ncbi:MAG: hypothetical protein HZC01_05405 [Candidatus Kerfeldbacteria bacterium]|nr:hypothetical protein [Candidatus Kerfeldbacteria bacterium]
MQFLDYMRIAVGVTVALGLPGFCISLALWPQQRRWSFERIIISIIISIITTSGLTYAANQLGAPFSLLTIGIVISVTSLISLIIYYFIKSKSNPV